MESKFVEIEPGHWINTDMIVRFHHERNAKSKEAADQRGISHALRITMADGANPERIDNSAVIQQIADAIGIPDLMTKEYDPSTVSYPFSNGDF
jgi:hypothetical protein